MAVNESVEDDVNICEGCGEKSMYVYGCERCSKMIGDCCYDEESCAHCGSPMVEE